MNKFEKLIEYIINDEDQKARELFHTIVVEKSRDIYESIMDEEQVEENFGGPVAGEQVESMVDEVGQEEAVGEDDEEGAELALGGDEEPAGEEDFGNDEVAHDEEAEEDKIMNIDAKLDELLAKFDEIMGNDDAEDMSAEEPAMDMGAEEVGAEVEGMYEGADEEEDEEECDDEEDEEPKKKATESRSNSTTELMREYVDRIGDIFGGQGDAAEGDAVGGSGKKTSVNTKSITGPGADFGGKTASSKGGVQNQDGNSAPSSEKPQVDNAGNINVPGGKAGSSFKTKEAPKAAEGSTTDGSVPVAKKSVQSQNTGK